MPNEITVPPASTAERRAFVYGCAAAAVLALALGLRLLGLDRGIWLDEWFSIRVTELGAFSPLVRYDVHPPLYYMILECWAQLGNGEAFLRLPSVLFGTAAVVVMMVWLWRRSPTAALLATLFCATHPLLLRYSQEIRSYPLLVLLTVLSFYFASRIIEQPDRRSGYVGLGICLALLPATQLVGIMIATAVGLFMVLHTGALRRISLPKTALGFVAAGVVFLVMYLFFLQEARHLTAQTWWQPPLTPAALWRTATSGLAVDEVASVLRRAAAAIGMHAGEADQLAVAGFVVLAVFLLLDGTWRYSGPLLAAALFYWLQLILYSTWMPNIVLARTLLPGLVPFAAFLGVHIAGLRGRLLRALCIPLLVVCCGIFGRAWAVQLAWRPAENWKGVANSLASQWRDGAGVIIFPPYAQSPLRYYLRDLRDEEVTTVAIDATDDTIIRQVDAAVSKVEGDAPLFFFVRSDSTAKRYWRVYEGIVRQIHARVGEPTQVRREGILEVERYDTVDD